MKLLPRLPLQVGPLTITTGIRGRWISPTVARETDVMVVVIPAGEAILTLELFRLPRRSRLVELPFAEDQA